MITCCGTGRRRAIAAGVRGRHYEGSASFCVLPPDLPARLSTYSPAGLLADSPFACSPVSPVRLGAESPCACGNKSPLGTALLVADPCLDCVIQCVTSGRKISMSGCAWPPPAATGLIRAAALSVAPTPTPPRARPEGLCALGTSASFPQEQQEGSGLLAFQVRQWPPWARSYGPDAPCRSHGSSFCVGQCPLSPARTLVRAAQWVAKAPPAFPCVSSLQPPPPAPFPDRRSQ